MEPLTIINLLLSFYISVIFNIGWLLYEDLNKKERRIKKIEDKLALLSAGEGIEEIK